MVSPVRCNGGWGLDRAVRDAVRFNPLTMLKNAPDFLRASGIDKLGNVGAELRNEVEGILKIVHGIVPQGGEPIEAIDKIIDKLPFPWKKKDRQKSANPPKKPGE